MVMFHINKNGKEREDRKEEKDNSSVVVCIFFCFFCLHVGFCFYDGFPILVYWTDEYALCVMCILSSFLYFCYDVFENREKKIWKYQKSEPLLSDGNATSKTESNNHVCQFMSQNGCYALRFVTPKSYKYAWS